MLVGGAAAPLVTWRAIGKLRVEAAAHQGEPTTSQRVRSPEQRRETVRAMLAGRAVQDEESASALLEEFDRYGDPTETISRIWRPVFLTIDALAAASLVLGVIGDIDVVAVGGAVILILSGAFRLRRAHRRRMILRSLAETRRLHAEPGT
jgi:hypothetical protein